MEVCGGHTHSIFRYGIETMLPEQIELVHGPGCPVCVLPMGRVDDCVALAEFIEGFFINNVKGLAEDSSGGSQRRYHHADGGG